MARCRHCRVRAARAVRDRVGSDRRSRGGAPEQPVRGGLPDGGGGPQEGTRGGRLRRAGKRPHRVSLGGRTLRPAARRLAAELVRRHVSVLATTGGIVSALAAKEATSVVPIVFTVGDDPVRHGLVGSLNRPGGNATGVVIMAADLGSKRLELVHEMVPSASHVVILVNPANPNMNAQAGGLRDTASKLGLRLTVLSASHEP